MENSLSQKRFFNTRKITILENRIVYKTTKFGNSTEFSVPYEELTNFKESHFISNLPIGIATIITFFMSLITFAYRNEKDTDPNAWIIITIAFLSFASYYFITRENVWKIKLEKFTYIFINKSQPNKTQVDNFINDLFEQRKKYLRETYLFINKHMSYDPQFKNLQWLKKVGVINQSEFENFRLELNAAFNTTEKHPIGFTKN